MGNEFPFITVASGGAVRKVPVLVKSFTVRLSRFSMSSAAWSLTKETRLLFNLYMVNNLSRFKICRPFWAAMDLPIFRFSAAVRQFRRPGHQLFQLILWHISTGIVHELGQQVGEVLIWLQIIHFYCFSQAVQHGIGFHILFGVYDLPVMFSRTKAPDTPLCIVNNFSES